MSEGYVYEKDQFPTIEKDPNAKLDYPFDWTEWLAGDTIASFVATVVGTVTIFSSANTALIVTVWLTGGTVGELATLACRITTAAGRIDERTIRVRIKEK